MKILKLPVETQIKCKCGCEFEFEFEDIIFDKTDIYSNFERFDYCINAFVRCPFCDKKNKLKTNNKN